MPTTARIFQTRTEDAEDTAVRTHAHLTAGFGWQRAAARGSDRGRGAQAEGQQPPPKRQARPGIRRERGTAALPSRPRHRPGSPVTQQRAMPTANQNATAAPAQPMVTPSAPPGGGEVTAPLRHATSRHVAVVMSLDGAGPRPGLGMAGVA